MKQILIPVLAAALAGSAAYAYVSSRKNAEQRELLGAHMAQWESERAGLQAELARERNRPVFIQTSAPPAERARPAGGLPPEEIIEQLRALRASPNDPRATRRVIHLLEQLVDHGPAAIPAIAAYLDQFEDVPYLAASEQNRRGDDDGRRRGGPGNWRRGSNLQLSFTTPPSLRFGLIDALQAIGGREAEAILAEVLATTGRPAELAYVTKVLQEMTPNAHQDTAVTAARDLLLNPPQLAAGDRLDENSKEYLYYVLNLYGDTSFAPAAQTMLVTQEGRIDREALDYLNNTLGVQAMPAIHAAFFDNRITNQMERASLIATAMNYAGPNAQANEMINAVVSDESVRPEFRAMAVMGLTRGEPDAATIQARLPLVEGLQAGTQDERLLRSLEFTDQNLQRMLAGEEPQSPWRMMRGRGEPGGRNR